MQEYFVARVESVPDGAQFAVQAGRRTIAIFRIGNEFYAIPNRCQHKGGSLCDGTVDRERKVIRCPWHLWDWSLTTGCVEAYPATCMPLQQVKVVDGEIRLYLHGPGGPSEPERSGDSGEASENP
jgi:nitrite reductase (NADH) small subunit